MFPKMLHTVLILIALFKPARGVIYSPRDFPPTLPPNVHTLRPQPTFHWNHHLYRERHLLDNATASVLDESELRALTQQCGSITYQLSVYVDSHVALVAVPLDLPSKDDDAIANTMDCSSALFIHHGSVAAGKEISTVRDLSVIDASALYVIGAVLLPDLGRAYEAVEVSDKGSTNGSSVVSHNCADFVADLAAALKIQVNHDVTMFVTSRLLQHSGSSLVPEIRENLGLLADLMVQEGGVGGLNETTSDHDLVKYLVETRTSKLYEE
jgi:hypothetical protein